MREFKTNKNEVSDEIVKKKFEEDLKEIKDKLNAENLSDEFMEKLNARLEEELNKDTTETKGKVINFPVISRKLAGICACFILFFSSCFAFADDIENVIFEIFGNTDKIVENAIEKGNYKEIDMEYVEDNGVSIKVDYVAFEDDNLYIVFNVLAEEAFDRILFDDIKIANIDDEILYQKGSKRENVVFVPVQNRISKNSTLVVYKLANINEEDLNTIKFEIKKINFVKLDIGKHIDGTWDFEINI